MPVATINPSDAIGALVFTKSEICAAVAFFDVPASLMANSLAAATAAAAVSAEILVSATIRFR